MMKNLQQMQQIMKQVQQMQEQLQKQLDGLVVDASAGGGMVSITMVNLHRSVPGFRLAHYARMTGPDAHLRTEECRYRRGTNRGTARAYASYRCP